MSQKLTVYAIEDYSGTRHIVATTTLRRAAALFGISEYMLRKLGGPTFQVDDIEQVSGTPDTVYSKTADEDRWRLVKITGRSKLPPPQGGWRVNAGRKPLQDHARAKNRVVRLTDDHFEIFRQRGGVSYLRRMLESSLTLSADQVSAIERAGGVEWLEKQLAAVSSAKEGRGS